MRKFVKYGDKEAFKKDFSNSLEAMNAYNEVVDYNEKLQHLITEFSNEVQPLCNSLTNSKGKPDWFKIVTKLKVSISLIKYVIEFIINIFKVK